MNTETTPAPKEVPQPASGGVIAWMRSDTRECCSAEDRAKMLAAKFGHWSEVAALYDIPLCAASGAPATPEPTLEMVSAVYAVLPEAAQEVLTHDDLRVAIRAAFIRAAQAPSGAPADTTKEEACPFCGVGLGEHGVSDGKHFQFCWNCHATGPWSEAALDGIAAWKRRAATFKATADLLHRAHDLLHNLVAVFVPSNDGAHEQTTSLMAEIRAALAENRSNAPHPAAATPLAVQEGEANHG